MTDPTVEFARIHSVGLDLCNAFELLTRGLDDLSEGEHASEKQALMQARSYVAVTIAALECNYGPLYLPKPFSFEGD